MKVKTNKNQRAQQMTEYMLLFAVVVVVVFWFVFQGPFESAVEDTLDLAIDSIATDANRINSI